ncbi:MAG: methionine ABC transporter substrate-binding protein, partial [Firmicutes bacterium]|nr:methionine ABC transporter substrate-binding protein [Bacillota bacterium]
MKKVVVIALVLSVVCFGGLASAESVLKVGATPVPHAEILEILVPLLAQEGISLEIVEFTDYVRPNLALQEGELDANFFQHSPYLESFNQDAGTNLVVLVGVHVE